MFTSPSYTRKSLYNSHYTPPKTSSTTKWILTATIGLMMVFAYFQGWLTQAVQFATEKVSYVVASLLGEQMTVDQQTQGINVLLVGYGGGKHDGAQLADSVMVASYHPKQHSVSLLALPRDLLVEIPSETHSGHINIVKLNSVLSRAYNHNGYNLEQAAFSLMHKAEQITNLTIPYYAMIDFDGFIQVVDSLGGIDVYLHQHFLDREYPVDWNGSYEIFELFT